MPYISTGAEELHYLQMGTGNKVILAFHGYGEQAGTFSVFEATMRKEYTILSFDLPYHGSTKWRGKQYLTEADLSMIVQQVCKQFKVEKVSLMGYSIGGRVCLSVLQALPGSIDRVLLMATDGLVINRFYQFCTRTLIGRFLFAGFLRREKVALSLAGLVSSIGLVPEAMYKLATQTLEPKEKRLQLLNAWPCLSLLVQPPERLKHTIAAHKIPVFIFMGARDKVLPPKAAIRFAAGVSSIQLHILDKGHRIFDAGNASQIASPLLQS